MTESLIGSVLGLAILALLAVVMSRANDCTGDCRQGRDCDCKGEKK